MIDGFLKIFTTFLTNVLVYFNNMSNHQNSSVLIEPFLFSIYMMVCFKRNVTQMVEWYRES